MPETLLSFSEVLLFGRVVEDLFIFGKSPAESYTAVVATTGPIANIGTTGLDDILGIVDTVTLTVGETCLVKDQTNKSQNGLYKVTNDSPFAWTKQPNLLKGTLVTVAPGNTQSGVWKQTRPIQTNSQSFILTTKTAVGRGLGQNKHLAEQVNEDAQLARIYGFSYEGAYYELPAPTIFLVHGEGESATKSTTTAENAPGNLAARAPNKPELSGVASADFQMADDIRVWPYDQSDYSIRMDVMTGQFEEILLDVYFGIEEPMLAGGRVSGGRVAGGRVSGGRVSGGRVSGGRVSGGRVSGGRVSGSGD